MVSSLPCLYLGACLPRVMRRTASNAATVLYCLLYALVTLAAAQTPQLCANPTITSTGTENYARMCGVNADAACEATASSTYGKTWHWGPEIAVDGVLSTIGGGYDEGFLTDFVAERAWWRVDFGTQRHVQSVYMRQIWDSGYWGGVNNARILVGGTGDHSTTPYCGEANFGDVRLNNEVPCNCLGRYLFVKTEQNKNLLFSELMAFGPCACPAGYINPSVGSGPCVACPSNSQSTANGSACECSAGYTSLPESCVICPEGWFKAFPGSAACDEV